MKFKALICLIFWQVLALVSFGASGSAAVTCQLALKGARQEIQKNKFITNRSLENYSSRLFPSFRQRMSELKPNDLWIDLGGGEGRAAEEYLQSKINPLEAAQVYLITYVGRRSSILKRKIEIPSFQGKLKVLEGRFFEEIPDQEIPQADMITDFYGVLSYTGDLSLTLRKIFRHLKLHGELYIHSSNMVTSIETSNGVMSLTSFLKSLSGLQVEGQDGILKITKEQEEIKVPPLSLLSSGLNPVGFHRRFQLQEK